MNRLTSLIMFLIPLTISYAIISDLGKPQHHYHSPHSIGGFDPSLSQRYGN
jgi:hypothetical protein